MRSRTYRALVILVGCMSVALAAAQEEKEKGKRGPTFMRGRGFNELLALLSVPEVKTALKITSEESAFLKLLEEEQREKAQKFFASQEGVDRAERSEKWREWSTKQNAELAAQVSEIIGADRLKRLKQIELQTTGPRAIFAAETQKELGLTDDQRQQLDAIRDNAREEMAALFRSRTANGGATPKYDPEAAKKVFEDLTKRQNEKILALLTEKQKEKWKEMQGEPIDFKFDRSTFFRRGDGQRRPRGSRGQPPAPKAL